MITTQNTVKDKILIEEITEMLHDMGTPTHIKGHRYIRTAILISYHDDEILNHMMNGLYFQIAKMYQTTPSCVERGIRSAIEITWDRGDPKYLYMMFKNTIHGKRAKPTNKEFITMMVDKLHIKHM